MCDCLYLSLSIQLKQITSDACLGSQDFCTHVATHVHRKVAVDFEISSLCSFLDQTLILIPKHCRFANSLPLHLRLTRPYQILPLLRCPMSR